MRDVINTVERKKALHESLQFPVDLLRGQMLRLSLKDKLFKVFQPAAEDSIDDLWDKCVEIEKDIQVIDRLIHTVGTLYCAVDSQTDKWVDT